MIVFPGLIVGAASEAGIKVPSPEEQEQFDKDCVYRSWPAKLRKDKFIETYAHWHVFCTVQLGRPMQHGEQFENAKVIAALSDEEIKTVTLEQLINKGLHYAS